MLLKHPPSPNRIRKIPKKFSWVDHKLVRDRHIHKCSHKAAALYLFLITVADAKELSYYADLSIAACGVGKGNEKGRVENGKR